MWSIGCPAGSGIKSPLRRFLVVGLLVSLSGCTGIKQIAADLKGGDTGSATPKTRAAFTDVLEASYTAADALAADLRVKTGKTGGSMLAASFVNINDLEKSSPLGRIVSEQIASRMAQNGFRMLEMKLRQHSIYIREGQGEFLLSRELKEIGDSWNSGMVIVGTYAVAEKSIYISARIVDTSDNAIITGYDYQVERNYQTDSLLTSAGG